MMVLNTDIMQLAIQNAIDINFTSNRLILMEFLLSAFIIVLLRSKRSKRTKYYHKRSLSHTHTQITGGRRGKKSHAKREKYIAHKWCFSSNRTPILYSMGCNQCCRSQEFMRLKIHALTHSVSEKKYRVK